jgi:hypothetical protein
MTPTTILRWATRDSFLVCLQADFGRLTLNSIDKFTSMLSRREFASSWRDRKLRAALSDSYFHMSAPSRWLDGDRTAEA